MWYSKGMCSLVMVEFTPRPQILKATLFAKDSYLDTSVDFLTASWEVLVIPPMLTFYGCLKILAD